MMGNLNTLSGFRATSVDSKRQKDKALGNRLRREANEKTPKKQEAEEN